MVIGEEIRVDVGVFLKRGHSGDTRAFITPSLVGVGAKNANSIWGEGVFLEGCFLALLGLGDVGVFWGCWGSFKWCLGCFEISIVQKIDSFRVELRMCKDASSMRHLWKDSV